MPRVRIKGACAVLSATLMFGCSDPPISPEEDFAITAPLRDAAVAHSNPAAMLEDLGRIRIWHAANGTGLDKALRAGLRESELDALEVEIGCKLPNELRSLWKWSDGHPETNSSMWFVWYHQLMPTKQSLEQYRYLLSEPDFQWDKSWVPVMYFQEEWYFVECTDKRVEASPLMYFFTEQGPREAYTNLGSYFATAREAMERGDVFVKDANGEMIEDLRKLSIIYARHNPGLKFPYGIPE